MLTVQKLKAPPRLQEYYSRKKVTMLKLAMAMHFSESLELEIQLPTFLKAIKWIEEIEPKIEQGLGLTGRNELHSYTKRIHEFIISKGRCNKRDVHIAFAADLKIMEINESLDELLLAGSIKMDGKSGMEVYYV